MQEENTFRIPHRGPGLFSALCLQIEGIHLSSDHVPFSSLTFGVSLKSQLLPMVHLHKLVRLVRISEHRSKNMGSSFLKMMAFQLLENGKLGG